jgi:hypothetical protein
MWKIKKNHQKKKKKHSKNLNKQKNRPYSALVSDYQTKVAQQPISLSTVDFFEKIKHQPPYYYWSGNLSALGTVLESEVRISTMVVKCIENNKNRKMRNIKKTKKKKKMMKEKSVLIG